MKMNMFNKKIASSGESKKTDPTPSSRLSRKNTVSLNKDSSSTATLPATLKPGGLKTGDIDSIENSILESTINHK
jgi:hypothetical protein